MKRTLEFLACAACIAIENDAVRSNIVQCFEKAHELMKELTA